MPDFRFYDKKRDAAPGEALHLTNVEGRPLYGEITTAAGFIHCNSFGENAALNLLYDADGFGRVVLHTLPLPHRADPYNLVLELARGRLHQIDDRREAWAGDNFIPSRILREEIETARRIFKKAELLESTNPVRCSMLANKALGRALWAGEGLALESAQHNIRKRAAEGSANQLKLGTNFFLFDRGDSCLHLFEQLCNFATLPFYWRGFEPEEGVEKHERIEAMLEWLLERGITPKGHPLVWLTENVYPDWARREDFEDTLDLNVKRARRIVERYKGRIGVWDIINEAHDVEQTAKLGCDRLKMIDLTCAVAEAVREADPTATSIVNVSVPFGDYAALKRGRWSPFEYIEACLRHGADFDVIGLQIYYGSGGFFCRDLLDISAYLDRFATFGKPIHITEIGCPSSEEPDLAQHLPDATVEEAGRWHGPWCETLQAEWAEKFATVCFGKAYVKALSWWDLVDYNKHFFTHGGLVRPDLTPKPSYMRLLKLAQDMGIRGQA